MANDLPDILSAAKVAESSALKELLGPAARIFGRYLEERADEIVEEWRRRRAKNVEAHRIKVKQIIGDAVERKPSEKQVHLAIEWTEGAQQFSPEEDVEISAIWESLLAAIYKNEDYSNELLRIVKQLDPSDAKIILEAEGVVAPKSNAVHRFKRLSDFGIFERRSALRRVYGNFGVGGMILMCMFGAAFVFAFTFTPSDLVTSLHLESIVSNEKITSWIRFLSIGLFLVMSLLLTSSVLPGPAEYELTEFGYMIKKSADRFIYKEQAI